MSHSLSRIHRAAPSSVALHTPKLADFKSADRSSLISRTVVRDSVRIADFIVTAAIGLAVAALYVPAQAVVSPSYIVAVFGVPLLAVALMEVFGIYRVAELGQLARQVPRTLLAWINAFAVCAVFVFLFKMGPDFSRVWLTAWFAAGAAGLVAMRFITARFINAWTRQGRLFRRAVVYGTGELAAETIAELEADASADLRIAGIFDERQERAPKSTLGYPLRGGIADLVQYARSTRIDVIILAVPMSAESRLSNVLAPLSQLPVEIKVPARASTLQFAPKTYSRIGQVRMINLIDKPITAWGGVAKMAFDKVIATLALVALSPMFAVTALAIKLESKGPVFFKQKRYGFNNELIEIYKFRSMYTDQCDRDAAKLVTKGDPRVTGVGRFIRKSSIDELPQLLNVLKGDLSLVGPRPHALSAKAGTELYDRVVDDYFARHKVKPGITGWAQINGWRGETDTPHKIQQRVSHDLYYIENWSVLFDLYILLKTPLALFKTDNAY